MKKMFNFFVVLFFSMLTCICVHAEEPLSITTTTLNSGDAYQEYYDKVEATGGSGDYTFKYVGGLYPKGIVFGSDGTISGIPTHSGTYVNVKIRVTDNVTNESVTKRFSLSIKAKLVDIEISDTDYTYELGHTYKATVISPTELSLVPTVTYGNDMSEVTQSGSYLIKVKLPSGYRSSYNNDRVLTVRKNENSNINVKGLITSYDGEGHGAEVMVEPEGLSYEVLYRKIGDTEYTTELPIERGKYEVYAHTTDLNYQEREASSIIEITDEIINFNVTDTTQKYTGEELAPSIKPSKDIGFTVQYKNKSTGDITDTVSEVGEYQIIITPETGYTVGMVFEDTFIISKNMVDVTITADKSSIVYGETFSLHADGGEDCDMTGFVISLVNQETYEKFTLTDIVPTGKYTIKAKFNDSEIGVGSIIAPELTVIQKSVLFEVANTELEYTGKAQEAVINPLDEMVKSDDYIVKYKKVDELSETITNPGTYNVVITFENHNFKIDETFNATVTIKPYAELNIGNSPAAMIQLDSSKNDEWKTSAMSYFTENKKFSDEYLPKGCSTEVTYTSIGTTNYDIDKNTVIVQKWSDFIDPGMTVIDENGQHTVMGVVEGQVPEKSGLYTVNYTDPVASKTRYVMVLGDLFADVNGDGIINAIDANKIKKRISVSRIQVENVFDARICDVTKDGKLDSSDVNAIFSRFLTELKPYYPWVK